MTEGERIIKLETQMNNIEQKVDAGFKASEKRHDELKTMLEGFDKKFASKWVEKTFISIGSVVGLAIVGAVLSLILIK